MQLPSFNLPFGRYRLKVNTEDYAISSRDEPEYISVQLTLYAIHEKLLSGAMKSVQTSRSTDEDGFSW